ncbi:hypothetical protein BKA70DRAFT_1394537 [Coprinopsis sp. MPI-PUGE-AT-0042]|nr:hypothetical protein BKA70DRAFT_1394537 [Coprinopsis sp. MPI-PUGE-AT-0042]
MRPQGYTLFALCLGTLSHALPLGIPTTEAISASEVASFGKPICYTRWQNVVIFENGDSLTSQNWVNKSEGPRLGLKKFKLLNSSGKIVTKGFTGYSILKEWHQSKRADPCEGSSGAVGRVSEGEWMAERLSGEKPTTREIHLGEH